MAGKNGPASIPAIAAIAIAIAIAIASMAETASCYGKNTLSE